MTPGLSTFTSETLTASLVIGPLLAAALLAVLPRPARRRVAPLASLLLLAGSVVLLAEVADAGPVRTAVGGWVAPVGIALRADLLGLLLLATTAVIVLATHLLAAARGEDAGAQPAVLQVLTAGAALAFLTADLFTLFVAFEVALIASAVLLAQGRSSVLELRRYVLANAVVSTILLAGVTIAYQLTGTVDLDLLAARWPSGSAATLSGGLLAVAFLAKAAAVPLWGWMPGPYAAAPTAAVALFGGVLTKLGVHALLRTRVLTGLDQPGPARALLVVACVTMVGGALAALAQRDLRRLLSFHVVSQVGYLLLGIALATTAGIAATVYYLVHHMLVKSALFAGVGAIEDREGTVHLDRLGGLGRGWGLAAALLVAVPAASLAGIPPLSGFVAKLAVLDAAVGVTGATGEVAWGIGAALVAGLLTLASMTKYWGAAFLGESSEGAELAPAGTRRPRPALLAPAGLLLAASLVVTFGAGEVLRLADLAADQLTSVQRLGGAS